MQIAAKPRPAPPLIFICSLDGNPANDMTACRAELEHRQAKCSTAVCAAGPGAGLSASLFIPATA